MHLFDSGHPYNLLHSHICLVHYMHLHSDTLDHTQLNKKKLKIKLSWKFNDNIRTHVFDSGHLYILLHRHMCLVQYMYLHSDILDHTQLNRKMWRLNCPERYNQNARVWQWSFLYPVVQKHVFGALQVPPFWHSGSHTAKEEKNNMYIISWYFNQNAPVWQWSPVYPVAQSHVFGALHVPPFWHSCSHTAKQWNVLGKQNPHDMLHQFSL